MTSTEQTYSLEEAAQIICGTADPAARQWLTQRLRGNAQPALTGYRAQRRWRMTQADIDAAIEALRPAHAHLPAVPALTSMTAGSRRRLGVAQ